MRGGKASPNTPCHSGNQTAATKPARVSFSFLYFFYFYFSPPPTPSFFSFPFFSLFAHCFFFPFITISFSKVGKRHETPKAVLQGFRVVLKDFFFFFFFPPPSPLQAPAIDTTRDKLVREQTASFGLDPAAGKKAGSQELGKLSGGFSTNLSPHRVFLLFLFSFGSFVLLCFGFPVVLNSLRCWN